MILYLKKLFLIAWFDLPDLLCFYKNLRLSISKKKVKQYRLSAFTPWLQISVLRGWILKKQFKLCQWMAFFQTDTQGMEVFTYIVMKICDVRLFFPWQFCSQIWQYSSGFPSMCLKLKRCNLIDSLMLVNVKNRNNWLFVEPET